MEGYGAHERLGRQAGGTHPLAYAAEAMALAGDWEEAQKHVDEALSLAERLGERVYVADLLRQQGRIEAAIGQPERARRSIGESLRLARTQDALWLELAALVELCEPEEGSVRYAANFALPSNGCRRVTTHRWPRGCVTGLAQRATSGKERRLGRRLLAVSASNAATAYVAYKAMKKTKNR